MRRRGSVPFTAVESQGGPASVTGEYTGGSSTSPNQYQGQGYDSIDALPPDVGHLHRHHHRLRMTDYLYRYRRPDHHPLKALSAEMKSRSPGDL